MQASRRRAAIATGLAVALGACSGGGGADPAAVTTSSTTASRATVTSTTAATFGADAADTVLSVGLRNYVVVGVPAAVQGPKVWIAATVIGGRRHELEVVDAEGDPVGALDPFQAADGEQHLALSLAPGTYTVRCLVRYGTRTHAALGMRQDFVVR